MIRNCTCFPGHCGSTIVSGEPANASKEPHMRMIVIAQALVLAASAQAQVSTQSWSTPSVT